MESTATRHYFGLDQHRQTLSGNWRNSSTYQTEIGNFETVSEAVNAALVSLPGWSHTKEGSDSLPILESGDGLRRMLIKVN